ncbi:hypothetical protein chiPu_0029284, partial [Chiloscyllium punctatum]|nr:hypothetical protein [Chiloscyllium punctatum]
MTWTLCAATFSSARCPPPVSPSSPSRNSGNLSRKRSRQDRAQLALDLWSTFERVYWSAHDARQAPGLDMNDRKRVRDFLWALL